jgi:hypothetical protein
MGGAECRVEPVHSNSAICFQKIFFRFFGGNHRCLGKECNVVVISARRCRALPGKGALILEPMCPPSYSASTILVLLNIRGKDVGPTMIESLQFRVETADEDVVVTLSGTSYMVKYCKADSPAGLKLYHSRGDDSAPIHDIHFLARAWQLANAKAKELGWFAQTGP